MELVRLLAQHGARVSDAAFYTVLATADEDPHANMFYESGGHFTLEGQGRGRGEQ